MEPGSTTMPLSSELNQITEEFRTNLYSLRQNIDSIRENSYNIAHPSTPFVPEPFPPNAELSESFVLCLWQQLDNLNRMNRELSFLSEHLTRIAGK